MEEFGYLCVHEICVYYVLFVMCNYAGSIGCGGDYCAFEDSEFGDDVMREGVCVYCRYFSSGFVFSECVDVMILDLPALITALLVCVVRD